mmetsp:Transcript_71799/g.99768  ORF Transcript_71799/g.99768 Transcript_71799/m.99768 type:complete len:92 (+) Transcript_71799:187-462(+)
MTPAVLYKYKSRSMCANDLSSQHAVAVLEGRVRTPNHAAGKHSASQQYTRMSVEMQAACHHTVLQDEIAVVQVDGACKHPSRQVPALPIQV